MDATAISDNYQQARLERWNITVTPRRHFLARFSLQQKIGFILMIIALGGLLAAFAPIYQVEINYFFKRLGDGMGSRILFIKRTLFAPVSFAPQPSALPAPVVFNPLKNADGSDIIPINTDFSIVIPKLGINAPVIAGVNPAQPASYVEALKKGVAHASTSFYPNENGTVYLFSHSTNYAWYVKDLNAVFYLVKDLTPGDTIVLIYLHNRYTYQMTEQRIISAKDISYLPPPAGARRLILQTCWPPGTTFKRLLVFAKLIDEQPLTQPTAPSAAPTNNQPSVSVSQNTGLRGSFATLLSSK